MLFHAVNRFYNGQANFIDWVVSEFQPTFIPKITTFGFAMLLPYAEGLVGFTTEWIDKIKLLQTWIKEKL